MVLNRNNRRHPIVYRADKLVGGNGDDAKRALPLTTRIAPVLAKAGDSEWFAVVHVEGVKFLRLSRS